MCAQLYHRLYILHPNRGTARSVREVARAGREHEQHGGPADHQEDEIGRGEEWL